MLTLGHIATSYLIAMGAKNAGLTISSNEILQIVIAGNIMDIDFIIGQFIGKTGEAHHQNITHTPIGAILLLFMFIAIFNSSAAITVVFSVSLFLHLILDDIGYWMYRLNFYKTPTNPQINWLYPFTSFHKNKLIIGNKKVLHFYLFKAWPVALLEFILISVAIYFYLISMY